MGSKAFGERNCPYCKKIFFTQAQLDGHIGGAHRKDITKEQIPKCKKCGVELIRKQNWPDWAIRQRNLICSPCKKQQNKESYYRKKEMQSGG